MLSKDIKDIKSSPRDLKNFGLSMGLAFILLSLLFFWQEKQFYFYFLVVGNIFVVLSELCPAALKPLQKPWMLFVVVLGFLMSRLVLSIIFYLVVTPLGLVLRLFGKGTLDLEIDKSKVSYWHPRADVQKVSQKEYYERQF